MPICQHTSGTPAGPSRSPLPPPAALADHRTSSNKVLKANLFGSLSEVRALAHQSMISKVHSHRSLRKAPPSHYRQPTSPPGDSTFEMSC